MPPESLGSSPDFRLTAASLPPRGVVARLLEAFVRWAAHRAMELDDRSIVAIAEWRNLRRADRDFQGLDDRIFRTSGSSERPQRNEPQL